MVNLIFVDHLKLVFANRDALIEDKAVIVRLTDAEGRCLESTGMEVFPLDSKMGFLNYLIIVYFIIVLLHEHWCRPPLIVYLKLLKIVLGLCLFGALECDLAQILAIKRDKGV